jgi:hypothetical protein
VTLLSCCMHYLRPRGPALGLRGWLLAFYGSSSTGIPMLPCGHPERVSPRCGNHREMQEVCSYMGFSPSHLWERETVKQCAKREREIIGYISPPRPVGFCFRTTVWVPPFFNVINETDSETQTRPALGRNFI